MSARLLRLFPVAESANQRDVRSRFVEEQRSALQGKRAFVIGNGPSLRASDLDRIAGEVSFGANLISLIFPHTSWRPRFISVTDPLVWTKVSFEGTPESIPWLVDSSFANPNPSREVVGFKRFARLSAEYYQGRVARMPFSEDINRGFFGGYSVTFFNIQLAFSLGLNPVYLLGVDHRFLENRSGFFSRPVRVAKPTDHFDPGYRREGEVVNSAPVRAIERAMRSLEHVEEQTGFRVVDLTRDGALPFAEKMSFDEVVAG